MSRRVLAVIFLAALIPRLFLWLRLSPSPQLLLRPDSHGYLGLADSLAQRQGFSLLQGDQRVLETFRTPGYPAFLSAYRLFSKDPRWPALGQVVLDSVTALLVALCAGMLLPGNLAWIAGVLYALEPVVMAHSVLIISESLFTFLMVWSLYGLLRAGTQARLKPLLFSAFFLGLAAMTRPIAVYLWIPWTAALAIMWGRKKAAALLLYVVVATAAPALWCARNLHLFGHFGFSSISGANFLFYEAVAVDAVARGIPESEARRGLLEGFLAENPNSIEDPFEESRLRRAYAGRILSRYPASVVRVHALSAFKMLLGPGLELIEEVLFGRLHSSNLETPAGSVSGRGTMALLRQRPWLWSVFLFTEVLLVTTYLLSLRGIWTLWLRHGKFFLAACLVPLAYLVVISSGGWCYYRFRVPLWPFFCLLACAGLRDRSFAPSGAGRSL